MKVLIAEDDVASRKLLDAVLTRWGYSVVCARDGKEAWKVLSSEDSPSIVILDWLMPGLTGPEICQKLSDRQDGSFVYTILLTSKTDKSDKIEALDAGAYSYLRKPLDQLELQSCLRVGERVLRYEETLRENNSRLTAYATQMEQLAEERAQQLTHADRMATLGLLAAGIAHEINNPATFISGNAQILKHAWGIILPLLETAGTGDTSESKQMRLILEEVPEMIEGIQVGVKRIAKITDGLKGYARRDQSRKVGYDIDSAIEKALMLCRNAQKYNVEIRTDLCENPPELVGDVQQIEQILVNLIMNARYAMASVENGVLSITTTCNESAVDVVVEDTGHGIPAESIDKIFDPFFTTKKAGDGTGLGLSISNDIARDHGGALTAENRREGGAKFILRLPILITTKETSSGQIPQATQGE